MLYNNDHPILQTVAQAAKTIGVSQYWLREGLKANTVPHIKSGSKYLVNIPATIAWINAESEANADGKQV